MEIKNLSIKIRSNGRPLVENLSLIVNKGDKIAIIGEEGNGKTTLLKAIIGKESLQDIFEITGTIYHKGNIQYLEQDLTIRWGETTINSFFLIDDIQDGVNYDNYNKYQEYERYLSVFGLDSEILLSDRKIKTLSGGEKVKIQLAKILCNNPTVILLDEPTNDIDIETLEWLENFINSSEVPIIYVSHDETLLENTANCIVHLELINKKQKARTTVERTDYSSYIDSRDKNISKHNQKHYNEKKVFLNDMKNLRELKRKIERYNPERDNSMRTIKAKEARLERDGYLEYYDTEDSINVFFKENIFMPHKKEIININIPNFILKNNKVLKNIVLNVVGPEHVVIIGENGVGKTTLIKFIYEELKNRKDIELGYMPQDYSEILSKYDKPLDFLYNPKIDISFIRSMMGNLKFNEEEQIGLISDLSGGQKAKLFILRMILDEKNVLILDEPTRNLSPLSNPVIRRILESFPGTIISVSHDRKYIESVADKLYELTSIGIFEKNK